MCKMKGSLYVKENLGEFWEWEEYKKQNEFDASQGILAQRSVHLFGSSESPSSPYLKENEFMQVKFTQMDYVTIIILSMNDSERQLPSQKSRHLESQPPLKNCKLYSGYEY